MARNKYPEETVRKILEAAHKLFIEKGYEQTTILDIVENMGGLTRGAFYHHFKSKEEVLDALGSQLFYDNNPFTIAKQQTDLNGLQKLKYLIKLSMEPSEVQKISIASLSALKSPTFLKRLIDDNRDILSPSYQELIEEGIADGSIQSKNPKELSQLLTFLTNFWMVPTVFPASEEEAVVRLLYAKEILDKMGLPLLDDEIIASAVKNSD